MTEMSGIGNIPARSLTRLCASTSYRKRGADAIRTVTANEDFHWLADADWAAVWRLEPCAIGVKAPEIHNVCYLIPALYPTEFSHCEQLHSVVRTRHHAKPMSNGIIRKELLSRQGV